MAFSRNVAVDRQWDYLSGLESGFRQICTQVFANFYQGFADGFNCGGERPVGAHRFEPIQPAAKAGLSVYYRRYTVIGNVRAGHMEIGAVSTATRFNGGI